MSAQHTPGPWKVRKAWDDDGYEVYPTHDGKKPAPGCHWAELATVPEGSSKHGALANARLIAAAPELLEALELGLADCIDLDGTILPPSKSTIAMWRAAISKAKGAA